MIRFSFFIRSVLIFARKKDVNRSGFLVGQAQKTIDVWQRLFRVSLSIDQGVCLCLSLCRCVGGCHPCRRIHPWIGLWRIIMRCVSVSHHQPSWLDEFSHSSWFSFLFLFIFLVESYPSVSRTRSVLLRFLFISISISIPVSSCWQRVGTGNSVAECVSMFVE